MVTINNILMFPWCSLLPLERAAASYSFPPTTIYPKWAWGIIINFSTVKRNTRE